MRFFPEMKCPVCFREMRGNFEGEVACDTIDNRCAFTFFMTIQAHLYGDASGVYSIYFRDL